MNSLLHSQLLFFYLILAVALAVFLGRERIQAEIDAAWLVIRANFLHLYAWLLDKVVIRFVRVRGQVYVAILERRARIMQQSIESSHRRAEYNRISAEYWRTKARTTRRIRLLRARLAGEITEDEYRNALAQDKQDVELAKKRKRLAKLWAYGKMAETDYRQQMEAISGDELSSSRLS